MIPTLFNIYYFQWGRYYHCFRDKGTETHKLCSLWLLTESMVERRGLSVELDGLFSFRFSLLQSRWNISGPAAAGN